MYTYIHTDAHIKCTRQAFPAPIFLPYSRNCTRWLLLRNETMWSATRDVMLWYPRLTTTKLKEGERVRKKKNNIYIYIVCVCVCVCVCVDERVRHGASNERIHSVGERLWIHGSLTDISIRIDTDRIQRNIHRSTSVIRYIYIYIYTHRYINM